MKNNTFLGTIIGIVFFTFSLFMTITYVIPIISILPAVYLEGLSSILVKNEPYSNVGKMTIIILTLIFTVYLIFSIFYIRKIKIKNNVVTKNTLILLMLIMYLIIHPLVMYIYWAIKYDYRDDGQLIFMAVETFPISSLFFILFGIILDITKNINYNKTLSN